MTARAMSIIHEVMASETYRKAVATLTAEHDRTVEDIVTLTQIAAPPFEEETRARAFLAMAKIHGLQNLEIDAEGNVTGMRPGVGNGPLICVAAHLDTVFPAGTDVTVRRDGAKLYAPGVGDDTRSLAVLLAWLRAMDAAAVRTRADLLFVADVGEEGPGDLRGMRHLFQNGPYKDRISAFITVDSPDISHIATGGVGSKRYRVTFKGPGGHSYGAFGLVNPMFAMADAIARLGRVTVPASPKTTYSASVTGGGTSINSIPNQRVDGFRPAIGVTRRTGPAGGDLPRSGGEVGRGRERGTLDAERSSDDGHRQDRRPAGRPYRRDQRPGAPRAGGDQRAWVSAEVRNLLDRREHSDEPRHPRDQDRLRRHRRSSALAGGMDRRGTGAVHSWHGRRPCNGVGRRRFGLTEGSERRFQHTSQRIGCAVQRHMSPQQDLGTAPIRRLPHLQT